MSDLPAGFVLDRKAEDSGLPAGFAVDRQANRPKDEPSALGGIWNGIVNFGSGLARGVAGSGAPQGRGSQYPGGRAGFAGQAIGAGAHSVLEGMWDALRAPGEVYGGASGDLTPRMGRMPSAGQRQEMAARAPATALLMTGQDVAAPAMRPLGQALRQDAPRAAQGIADVLRDTRGGAGAPGVPGPSRPAVAAPGGRVEPLPATPLVPGGAVGPSPYPGAVRQQPAAVAIPGGRGGIPGEPRPAAPGGLEAGGGGTVTPISPLAGAIVTGDNTLVDRTLTRAYRRAVRPGRPLTEPSLLGLDRQDMRIVQAVDQIIAARPNLKLTDAAGNEVTGKLPQSMRQFGEALDQTKREVFRQYDAMAERAGAAGVQVDLGPIIGDLRRMAADPVLLDQHPEIANYATAVSERLQERRFYSPAQAQDAIEMLNKDLKAYWRNPTPGDASRHTVQAEMWSALRNQLDRAIDAAPAGGPGYLALRNRYGALRSVEREVAAALQRNANRIPGGLAGQIADIAGAERVLHGIVTLNPQTTITGATIAGARRLIGYVNDPNRAIRRMFERRGAKIGGGYHYEPSRRALAGTAAYAAGVGDNNSSLYQPR